MVNYQNCCILLFLKNYEKISKTYLVYHPLPPYNSDNMIAIIIAWLIQITAVLTILAVTWAAIQMMLAVGEEEKMKKARYTMIYAFIGLGVA